MEESKLSIEIVEQEYIEIPTLPTPIQGRVEQERTSSLRHRILCGASEGRDGGATFREGSISGTAG